MISSLFQNFNWFKILTFFVELGFLISLIWDMYVLKPFNIYLSNRSSKPFYDGNSTPALSFAHGKYMVINTILLLGVFLFISFVIPELLFPGQYYLLFAFLVLCIIFPCIIIKSRMNIFHDPQIIKISENESKIVNFKDGSYSSSYYCLLTIFNMGICFIFGILRYSIHPQAKSLIVIMICIILEFMIIFVDQTDKIMPFNMQKESGFWIFSLILALIVMGVAFRL